jgi:hypothetical protein
LAAIERAAEEIDGKLVVKLRGQFRGQFLQGFL